MNEPNSLWKKKVDGKEFVRIRPTTVITRLTLIFWLVTSLFTSCYPVKPIHGVYYLKFAELSMIGSRLTLNSDSSFEYVTGGDMMYDSATGHYTVIKNKIYIFFNQEAKRDLKLYYSFDTLPVRTIRHSGYTIRFK